VCGRCEESGLRWVYSKSAAFVWAQCPSRIRLSYRNSTRIFTRLSTASGPSSGSIGIDSSIELTVIQAPKEIPILAGTGSKRETTLTIHKYIVFAKFFTNLRFFYYKLQIIVLE
jgi:hypothetical protein